jgi:hypothetical protein
MVKSHCPRPPRPPSKRPDRHWRDGKRPFGDAYRLSTADKYCVSLWVYDRLAHMAWQAHKVGKCSCTLQQMLANSSITRNVEHACGCCCCAYHHSLVRRCAAALPPSCKRLALGCLRAGRRVCDIYSTDRPWRGCAFRNDRSGTNRHKTPRTNMR